MMKWHAHARHFAGFAFLLTLQIGWRVTAQPLPLAVIQQKVDSLSRYSGERLDQAILQALFDLPTGSKKANGYALLKAIEHKIPKRNYAMAHKSLLYLLMNLGTPPEWGEVDQLMQQAHDLSESDGEPCEFSLHFLAEKARMRMAVSPPLAEEAEQILDEVAEESLKKSCDVAYIHILTNKARWLYKDRDQYFEGMKAMQQAALEGERLGVRKVVLGEVYGELGLSHYFVGNYEMAIPYFHTQLRYYLADAVEGRLLVHAYNNLGLSHQHLQHRDSAFHFFEACKQEAIRNRDTVWVGLANGSIGDLYMDAGQYKQALPLLVSDYELSERHGERVNALRSMLEAVRCLLQLDRMPEAERLLALTLQKRNQWLPNDDYPALFKEMQAEIWRAKAMIAERKQQFDSAYVFLKYSHSLQDTLRKRDDRARLALLEAEWVTQKAQEEQRWAIYQAEVRQRYWAGALGILALVVVALTFALRNYRLRHRQQALEQARLFAEKQAEQAKSAQLEAERELLAFQQRQLQSQLENQDREMLTNAHLLAQKNEMLQQLAQQLRDLAKKYEGKIDKQEVNNLTKSVQQNIQLDNDWDKFKHSFEKVHPSFFKQLVHDYPQLTSTDLRLCSYLKMGLSSNEIASLMGISMESLRNSRNRLRQRMGLPKAADLAQYFLQL